MDKIPTISEAKLQVMKVLWANAPIRTNEVVEKLTDITLWKSKTIQTLLSRLVKKQALNYERSGRVFVYTPIVKESQVLEQENYSFLNRFYNGALNPMVLNLLELDRLSDDDISKLKEILEKKFSNDD